jgi:HlyD family secretion protein/epimerase transport system membrane fusion protein
MSLAETQPGRPPALVRPDNGQTGPWPITSLSEKLGGSARRANFAIIGLVLGFVVWGAVWPLTSAIIASGVVSPEGSRKTIQHLEGGIVEKINVKENELVQAGQVLIEMDDTQAQASTSAIELQWLRLRAMRTRLLAVQTAKDTVVFDQDIEDAASRSPDLAAFLSNERLLYTAAISTKKSQDDVLLQQIEQSKKEIAGLEAMVKGLDRQLELIEDELESLRALERKGLVRKPRMLELQRGAAGIQGERSANQASIARALQRISQIEVQRIGAMSEFQRNESNDILNTNSQIAEIEEKLTAARDVLARTKITAPVTGKVFGLQVKSPGAVLRPGQDILAVVPTEVDLVIDARVAPNDIESVHPGMMADVQITPFSHRYSKRLQGEVTKVSSDTFVDEATRMPYFLATVIVNRDELAATIEGAEMTPGMPAEVFIDTGRRTMIDYLLQPITRTMSHAFRD